MIPFTGHPASPWYSDRNQIRLCRGPGSGVAHGLPRKGEGPVGSNGSYSVSIAVTVTQFYMFFITHGMTPLKSVHFVLGTL